MTITELLEYQGFALVILVAAVITAVGVIWKKIVKPVLTTLQETHTMVAANVAALTGQDAIIDKATGEVIRPAVDPLAKRMQRAESIALKNQKGIEDLTQSQKALTASQKALTDGQGELTQNLKQLADATTKFSTHEEWSHAEHKEFRADIKDIKVRLTKLEETK